MNTIKDKRMLQARMSAGWAHDSNHYRFQRTHDSRAPFPSDRMKFRELVDSTIGAAAWVALVIVLLMVGGAI